MLLPQHARLDALMPVAFMSSRRGKATPEDGGKLERVQMYLNATADLKMTLRAEDELKVYAYVDASFAVHHDCAATMAVLSLSVGA
jgi:hypothetical protein